MERIVHATLVVLALQTLSGCRRTGDRPAPSPSRTLDAGPAVVPSFDADAAPLALDDARTAADSLDVDAAELGGIVDVRLVRQLQGQSGTARQFRLLLVLASATGDPPGLLVVPIEGAGFALDGESGRDEKPVGALIGVPPRVPAGAWDAASESMDAPLPASGSLVYRETFHLPGGNDHVAVVHAGDRLQAYFLAEESGAGPSTWALHADVRLSPGARLRAR